MENEMTTAEIVEWQNAEFPQCDVCDGRIGMDCHGHCPGCYDEPVKGEDFCAPCLRKVNAIGTCGRCGDPNHNGQCEGFGDS